MTPARCTAVLSDETTEYLFVSVVARIAPTEHRVHLATCNRSKAKPFARRLNYFFVGTR